jgi:hypothetical protein
MHLDSTAYIALGWFGSILAITIGLGVFLLTKLRK